MKRSWGWLALTAMLMIAMTGCSAVSAFSVPLTGLQSSTAMPASVSDVSEVNPEFSSLEVFVV